MAGASKKKIQEKNKKALFQLYLNHSIVVAVYCLFKLYYRTLSITEFVLLLGTQATHFGMVWMIKQCAQDGMDLDQQQGLLQYYYDLVYIGQFVLLGSIWTLWIYLVYLIVPIYAFSQLSTLRSKLKI